MSGRTFLPRALQLMIIIVLYFEVYPWCRPVIVRVSFENNHYTPNNCLQIRVPFLKYQFDFVKTMKMLKQRTRRKMDLNSSGELPSFLTHSPEVQDETWKVSPVPQRLQCRTVDLGDISPANTELFKRALKSSACGIQVTEK